MPWKRQVLVVANVTAGSETLFNALRERAQSEPTGFHLIVPATPSREGRAAAKKTLDDAVEQLRDAGLEADGTIGPSDPLTATIEAWDPKSFDEIVVSTLPMRFSKWLHAGLPERIARLTGAPVTHVVSDPPAPPLHAEPAPARKESDVFMGPLSVLTWGSASRRRSVRDRDVETPPAPPKSTA
jgi:GABA permease